MIEYCNTTVGIKFFLNDKLITIYSKTFQKRQLIINQKVR